MDLASIREEIRLQLTGGILELELSDDIIDRIIQNALRELQRYISSTALITVPFSKCIDLSTVTDTKGNLIKVSSVSRVYRAVGFTSDATSEGVVDPLLASQWQLLSGVGNMYQMQDYMYNYASWNTLLQMRNTTSTDLLFRYDKTSNLLYINISSNTPDSVTIEYVPRYDSVEEINSDYWIDILIKLSIAFAKIAVGRIRSRYTQSNALWTQDGEAILAEGNTELTALREHLETNSQLVYPID